MQCACGSICPWKIYYSTLPIGKLAAGTLGTIYLFHFDRRRLKDHHFRDLILGQSGTDELPRHVAGWYTFNPPSHSINSQLPLKNSLCVTFSIDSMQNDSIPNCGMKIGLPIHRDAGPIRNGL